MQKTFSWWISVWILCISPAFLTSCEKTGLTEEEVAAALREALKVGTDTAVARLHKTDGYFGDPLVKILLPPEAQTAVSVVENLIPGLPDQLVLKINRAAENAAIEAKPIFFEAITSLTIQDAFAILNGPQNAATQYLREKTSYQLFNAFQPKIQQSLESVGAQQLWTEFTTAYNSLPLVPPIPDNLASYSTQKALDGLFLYIEKQEAKIRTDASARVTDLLRRVFG
ncbi:MAG: DUF4197 domain-containing protein [Flavobacteriales bacterium]|nr:DUF4197 domain-containing protein [Flavobacteriales bacterium]MDW8410678.1 DUF4197 domain-containing protein [Flavobacteriales bacterium]